MVCFLSPRNEAALPSTTSCIDKLAFAEHDQTPSTCKGNPTLLPNIFGVSICLGRSLHLYRSNTIIWVASSRYGTNHYDKNSFFWPKTFMKTSWKPDKCTWNRAHSIGHTVTCLSHSEHVNIGGWPRYEVRTDDPTSQLTLSINDQFRDRQQICLHCYLSTHKTPSFGRVYDLLPFSPFGECWDRSLTRCI